MKTGNNQNIGAIVEKPIISSRAWDWSQVTEDYWNESSDEFLPVALRWKERGCQTVLDLGCGKGRHSLFLAELGFHVTAVDLSPEGIEQLQTEAKRKHLENNINTVVCDMLSLPFPVCKRLEVPLAPSAHCRKSPGFGIARVGVVLPSQPCLQRF